MRYLTCIRVLSLASLLWMGMGEPPVLALPGGRRAMARTQNSPQREVDRVIRGRGKLEPGGCEEIRSHVGMPLRVLSLAPEGKMVKKGDLLVELNAFDLIERREEQEIRALKADLELAAAKASMPGAERVASETVVVAEKALLLAQDELKSYREQEFPGQVKAVETELNLAEEKLRMATARMARVERLVRDASAEKALLLEADLAGSEAEAQLRAARNQLDQLESTVRPRRTAQLSFVIAQRELDLLRARNERTQLTMQSEAAVRIAEAVRRMERERLARLEGRLRATKLYAPRDGTVFYPRDPSRGTRRNSQIRPGDVVHDDQVVVQVVDLTQFKLNVRLQVPLARGIEPGQSATVHCDALPARTFRGQVTDIKDSAGDSKEVLVCVCVDGSAKGLKAGMTATVEFDVSDK